MDECNLQKFANFLGIDPATLPGPSDGVALSPARIENYASKHEDLTDCEFMALETYLPPEPRLVGAVSNRNFINGLLWVRSMRRSLTHIPSNYARNPEAIRKKAERWALNGAWNVLRDALPSLILSERRQAELHGLCVAYSNRGERIKSDRHKSNRP